MEAQITLDTICVPSEDVVARKIEDDIVIVPIVAGIGDAEGELYTLNETGQAIWQRLDGQRTLRDVAESLTVEFSAPLPELEEDVLGFTSELARRGILVVKDDASTRNGV